MASFLHIEELLSGIEVSSKASMKPKMIICGNYGANNIGDEAILRSLIQKFEPSYEITVMSANPTLTSKKFNITAVGRLPSGLRSHWKAKVHGAARKALNKTREAIAECDVFLLGGGTLLTDTPLQSIIIWSKQVETAFKHNKEVWIYANGIGPFATKEAKKIAARILKRAHKVSVRDERSLMWAKQLGCEKATLIQDPVFEWQWEGRKSLKKIEKGTVIFVPRFWKKNVDKMESSFKEFIRYLVQEKGKKVIGIPFENKNKKDIKFLTTIFEQANVGEGAKMWADYLDEQDVINMIGDAESMLGMRLHSLIFSEITKTPFVGVAYMEKVTGLGESLQKNECIVPLEEISFEALKRAYKSSLNISR